ncbi:MAG: Xaa-Pro aminopeptidase, partial [Chloroflexota bacterium]
MSLQDYKDVILPLREQAKVKNTWLKERLETVIPPLMERNKIDMWLVVCREYNEDPIIMTMLPAPAMSARRRTILAFCKNSDGTVDRLSIDRYGFGDFYEGMWNPDQEGQWECVARIVKERDPETIGVNFSSTFAFGDGLSYSEADELDTALGEYSKRCISAEKLAVGWLETR